MSFFLFEDESLLSKQLGVVESNLEAHADLLLAELSQSGVICIDISDIEGGSRHDLFVVKGSEAVKTEIIFGTIGNEFCEIVSGVNEGDELMVDGINPGALDRIEIEN